MTKMTPKTEIKLLLLQDYTRGGGGGGASRNRCYFRVKSVWRNSRRFSTYIGSDLSNCLFDIVTIILLQVVLNFAGDGNVRI